MLIKATDNFQKIRKMSLPGKLVKKEFDELRAGKTVDVNMDTGRYLVRNNYAIEIKQKATKKKGV